MEELERYIISFLLDTEDSSLIDMVSYGDNGSSLIVIEKSHFFDEDVFLTPDSLPKLPLKRLNGIPILYGDNSVEKHDGRLLLKTDFIASTFFLITRYEECVRKNIRDKHGRFPGKESVLYREKLLMTPLADMYGRFLRECLRSQQINVEESPHVFRKVYLTHDVDQINTWNSVWHALRSSLKLLAFRKDNPLTPIRAFQNYKKFDPIYTFPWIVETDAQFRKKLGMERCEIFYFIMGNTDSQETEDQNYLCDMKKTQDLVQMLRDNDVQIGLHASYRAGKDPSYIKNELCAAEKILGEKITANRNHYLDSREPCDYRVLIENGITDDFTMGYADTIGFRLGTARPVCWIDPERRKVTSLMLHPLTVMEATISGPDYMNITDYQTAFDTVRTMLDTVSEYGGDICLLWHNTSFSKRGKSYHTKLYTEVLNYLECLKQNTN